MTSQILDVTASVDMTLSYPYLLGVSYHAIPRGNGCGNRGSRGAFAATPPQPPGELIRSRLDRAAVRRAVGRLRRAALPRCGLRSCRRRRVTARWAFRAGRGHRRRGGRGCGGGLPRRPGLAGSSAGCQHDLLAGGLQRIDVGSLQPGLQLHLGICGGARRPALSRD